MLRSQVLGFAERSRVDGSYQVHLVDPQSGLWVRIQVEERYPLSPPRSVLTAFEEPAKAPDSERSHNSWKALFSPSEVWRPGDDLGRIYDTAKACAEVSRRFGPRA